MASLYYLDLSHSVNVRIRGLDINKEENYKNPVDNEQGEKRKDFTATTDKCYKRPKINYGYKLETAQSAKISGNL